MAKKKTTRKKAAKKKAPRRTPARRKRDAKLCGRWSPANNVFDDRKDLTARQRAVLSAVAIVGTICRACDAAGVSYSAHRDWIVNNELYAEAFEEAMDMAGDALEAEARRRAVAGTTEPIIHNGQLICDDDGEPILRHKYSDTLLIFLLKGAKPEKYRARMDHTSGGMPIKAYPGYLLDEFNGADDEADTPG